MTTTNFKYIYIVTILLKWFFIRSSAYSVRVICICSYMVHKDTQPCHRNAFNRINTKNKQLEHGLRLDNKCESPKTFLYVIIVAHDFLAYLVLIYLDYRDGTRKTVQTFIRTTRIRSYFEILEILLCRMK